MIISSFHSVTNVLIARRFAGGLAIMDNSRKPDIAMFNVRGIGVAVKVKISISERSDLNISFCRTPKRCSSSITTRPRFLYLTSACSNLCVPITISTLPAAKSFRTCVCSFFVLKRDKDSICTGHSAKRSRKFSVCCWVNNVVGAKTATCFPACTAIKAARMATSVLPKPTSPQMS